MFYLIFHMYDCQFLDISLNFGMIAFPDLLLYKLLVHYFRLMFVIFLG